MKCISRLIVTLDCGLTAALASSSHLMTTATPRPRTTAEETWIYLLQLKFAIIYNTRQKSWNTCVCFPFHKVDLGITVISVLQNTRGSTLAREKAYLNSGEKTVWSRNLRIFPENSRETVSVSTICDEYCSSTGVGQNIPNICGNIICVAAAKRIRPKQHLANSIVFMHGACSINIYEDSIYSLTFCLLIIR